MAGPRTIEEIGTVNAELKDIEREVRDFRNDTSRATNDQNQKIHGIELEVRGASGKLDLIFLAQNDHETRIRSVERSTLKFAVWAALVGAMLSIAASAFFRKFFDDSTRPAQKLSDQYLDGDRGQQMIEMRRYIERAKAREQNKEGPQ